ncbi:MAG: hypothetical protein ACU843_07975, partial [Gammaproteobacteria bacterium]
LRHVENPGATEQEAFRTADGGASNAAQRIPSSRGIAREEGAAPNHELRGYKTEAASLFQVLFVNFP